MSDQVRITTREIGVIEPLLHGHFAEHLGRCIYGGLWVGSDDDVATENGIRQDTLKLLSDLEIPMLRWPGGCFADDYQWTDGIGPRGERPRRRNAHWTQGRANVPEESNAFGTHEFLTLCEELDCEPYLAANVGTGTPDMAADWVEYCNYDGDTSLVEQRRENGRENPWNVRYWGVGNENWGCGGNYAPKTYAEEYRRFATYLRSLRGPMGIDLDLVLCGHFVEGWNETVLETLQEDVEMVDHLSVHRYYHAGNATEFSNEEYYELFANASQLLDDIDDAASAINEHAAPGSIGIAVDEWGVWHPVAESDNGLEQPNTVRDAISAAGILDGFHHRADVLSMGNLAQTINVLQCLIKTDETAAWPTPTYHIFELHQPHQGRVSHEVSIDTESVAVGDGNDVPLLTASASAGEDDWFVTIANRDTAERTVTIQLDEEGLATVEAAVLFDDTEPSAHPDGPGHDYSPDPHDATIENSGTVSCTLPGSSVVSLSIA